MLTRLLKPKFFSTYAQQLNKIPTVDQSLIWMNCKDLNGNWHRICGYEGDSLLEVMTKNVIPIAASCQGGANMFSIVERPVEPYVEYPPCKECHVEIDQGWFNQMEIHKFEEFALTAEESFFRGSRSRLACCLRVEPWMKEMRFNVGHVFEAQTDPMNERPWYRR